VPVQAVGSTVWLSYLQRSIYRYLFGTRRFETAWSSHL